MPNDNKNIDSYLDQNIRMSLKASASPDFTFELMKRVELEKEFAKEDVKTDRMARYIMGSFISLMMLFAVIVGLMLKGNEEGNEAGYVSTMIEKFSNFVEYISIMATGTFGLAFNFETGIVILLVMACILLFSFAEKIIFRKS